MNKPNYKFGLGRCFRNSEDSYVNYCNNEGITCIRNETARLNSALVITKGSLYAGLLCVATLRTQ